MAERFLSWLWDEARPREGWLAFSLLLMAVWLLIASVNAAGWVPEDGVVAWTATLGLLLGMGLAKRPLGWRPAWGLLLAYGLATTVIYLGRLRPPLKTIFAGWTASSDHFRQNWGLMVDRVGGWLTAATQGGRSEETIVFAFVLGLIAWTLAAYVGWSTLRQRRPLAGLSALGFALALNSYYGGVTIWPLVLYLSLAPLLATAVYFADLEQAWDRSKVDYSSEVRLDLYMASAGIALALMAAAFTIPAVNLRSISRAVLNRPVVNRAEDTLEQVFAGVRPPQPDAPGQGQGPGVGAALGSLSRSGFPRSFLLGNAPELYETEAMTATVQGVVPPVTHWRGISYDVYTGRGWQISTERQELVPANQFIVPPGTELPEPESLLPPSGGQAETIPPSGGDIGGAVFISQTVSWLAGTTADRYTLGQPLRFDQDVLAYWRGLEDLSRTRGAGVRYMAVSTAPRVAADDLRAARLDDVPPAVMARYTELPETIPERVFDLASEVSSTAKANPYDQARAVERFLRQYTYSLDVLPPSAGQDPVDYFLFELQAGYCDYYASAMVIMARSLGLPARLASGFLAQAPDENGVQTMFLINAHSWAEIYFAGYGWIEFEPTAPFPSLGDQPVTETDPFDFLDRPPETPVPAIPPADQPADQPLSPWWAVAAVVLLLGGWWLVHRFAGRPEKPTGIIWVYGRLQRGARRLGQPLPSSQTPAEFATAFQDRLAGQLSGSRTAQRLVRRPVGALTRPVDRLSERFAIRQYGRPSPDEAQNTDRAREDREALAAWRRLRRPMWLLGLLHWLRRK